MVYPGGKDGAGVFQRLVNQIGPHEVFISAFLGDCALLRRKRPATWNVGIDLDRDAVNRFAGDASRELDRVLDLHVCDSVAWLRFAFELDRVGGWRSGLRRCGWFTCAAEEVFVYADPPYLVESRKSSKRLYRYELDLEGHRSFLRTALELPCRVMISHYSCGLYEDKLGAWRSFEFEAQTRGGVATEKVWCNFPEPVELHDPRWLGEDKRAREKYARRRRNLMRKLRALPAVERQSILAELVG